MGFVSRIIYWRYLKKQKGPFEFIFDPNTTKKTQEHIWALLEKDKSGAIVRIVLFAYHPESYRRASSFRSLVKMTPRDRRFAIRERLYDIASIYTSTEPLRPGALFSMNWFRQLQVGVILPVSLFIDGSDSELREAFSMPRAGNPARARLYQFLNENPSTKAIGTERIEHIMHLHNKCVINTGPKSSHFWRLKSTFARFGSYAVSFDASNKRNTADSAGYGAAWRKKNPGRTEERLAGLMRQRVVSRMRSAWLKDKRGADK
jgi:hypothetical protein